MTLQLFIALTGGAAIWLANDPKHRRWAPVLGLMSQPGFIYSTAVAEQWGMLALSLFYTAAWARGIVNQIQKETINDLINNSELLGAVASMTRKKTQQLIDNGLVISGFVLTNPETNDRCSVNLGRVDWSLAWRHATTNHAHGGANE